MLPYYEFHTADMFGFASVNWHHWHKEPGWPMHLHHQVEIVYMIQGQADVTIDNRTERLSAGDMAVVFPHCIHGYKMVMDKDDPHHMQGLLIAPHIMGDDYGERFAYKLPSEPFIRAEALDEQARFVLEQLFIKRRDKQPEVAKAYLQLLFSLIWPHLQTKTDSSHRLDNTLHRAIRYVMEHYHHPLQAKDVAAALNISPSHLARLFSQRLRMGFNEFVNQLRVQHAADRLRSSEEPITEIMVAVGFDNQSTFNRVFRKIHGMSPRDYRHQTRPR